MGDDKEGIYEYEGKYNRDHYLLTVKSWILNKNTKEITPFGRTVVACRNTLYTFGLVESKEGGYTIRDVKIHGANKQESLQFLVAPFADEDKRQTYLELAEDGTTNVIAFRDCTWQQKPMKELKVRYRFWNPITKKDATMTWAYYFDPQRSWICCGRRSFADEDQNVATGQAIYSYESAGPGPLPVLRRLEESGADPKDPSKWTIVRVYTVSEFRASAPFSDADFRLSAFGLPEPEGIKWPKPPKTWLWLICGGVVFAGVAAFFAWLKRRRALVPPPTPKLTPG
jgi:hypothetical protein